MKFFRLYNDGRRYVLLRLVEENGEIRGPNNAIMFRNNDEDKTDLMCCGSFATFAGFKYKSFIVGLVEIQ